MELNVNNQIIGIPVMQNQQDFVVSVFTIEQILRFTKYTKRLIVGYDEQNEPIYNNSIQRDVESSRVEKIADFLIEDPEATFPTNIVLSIPNQVIDKQRKHLSTIEIFLQERVYKELAKDKNNADTGHVFITIIDGQHRIRGIEVAIERLREHINSLNKTLVKSPDSAGLQSKLKYYSQRLKDLLY
ncbi:DNA sulfur modification protein DndB [Spirosoma utsteinense]|uniref:DNA sulfur modification protein DndB n=1 Tax=Spirosoma utsteinense TaxID=2585773 RepID=UPI001648AB98|nr:DNA sulfur modification protein DndB [Spirosoma utsteinense]MBC3786210.1 DGQHR domain-containing protein [Spirosoma utsteinense]